jgi:hypothetical protein
MLQTLLHFRNPDSTLDLNNQLAQFFQQGLISGGEVSPVGGILAVNVNPFKLIGIDGMVVLEDVNVQQLAVFANQTNYVVFLSKYIPNGPAIAEYQVLSASAYNSSPDKDHMTVFCTVTLPLGATQVLATQISYAERSELDAVGRNIIRGVLTHSANLPTANNRAGDLYVVTSTTLAPAIWSWSGTAWLNITDTLDIASILSKHRNNLYPNEIHLTDQQAIAATGTYGTPGVESLGVSINIPTSTFFLSEPISTDNLTTGDVIQFSTTGTLPSGINNTSTYYVIVMTQTQFQVATTLDNALASIAIQLLGTQSGTQTATFAENKYVTSTDPRLIPFESAGALDGLAGRPFVFGVPSIPPPSSTNPFVTGAYTFASPDSTLLTSGVGPFTLSTGPFYVGTGNAASVYQYFKLYVNGSPREFVDPITGLVSNTVGVFKDNLLTQPLIPSSDPSVIASNGFYNGTLYLTVSPGLTSPALVRYANEKTLLNINPAAFENVDYFSAQSTQEMILKTQAISGRVFDQGIPPDETNLQLRVDLNTETQFNIASTAGFMTVHPSQFERLSQTDFGANFPVQIDQTVLYAGSPYTIDYSVSNFVAFGLSSADVGPTASIIYASGPNLTSIPLGSFFIDSAGTRWRILNNGITGSVLIYTGGETVALYSAGGPYTAPGQIVAGNNPRELQLTNSHRVWQGTQTIPITGVDFLKQNETEALPPGGNANGLGAQAVTFIGQAILNNNGTNNQFYATATGTGRPIYNVLPKRDQNFYDERIVLIGSWDNNASGPWVEGSPAINSSGGTNSASPCGIEITGYLREVSLVTHMSVAQASAFTFYVFVDGSYRMAVQPTSDGITPNGTPFEVIRFPLNLPLGVHTVRIEIAGSSTSPFQLSSVQLFSTALNSILIDDAKDLANTDLLSVASVTKTLNNGLALSGLPFKGVWYVTPAGVVSLAYQTQKYYRWLSPALTAGGVLTVPSNVPNVQSGDVVRYENTALQYQNLQVTQGYQGAASVQLGNVTAPGSGASLSYLFRIPITSNASGTPVLGAAASPLDIEYTNLLFEDWDTGDANDITNASVGLQTSLVTILNDGITTLAVTNCTRVNANLAGYKDGLSLSSTTSEMNIQGYGTRMDVVFAGLSGTSTVSIEVDGQFTYTITINGTGGPERHTIFYNAPQQVHTARIFNPNIANTVVVAEWTFYDLEDPEYNGVPISQYSIPLPTSNLFGSDGSVGPTTIPVQYNSAGVVVRDVTRFGTFHSASAGWSLIQDFTVNSRFGYYATTTTNLDYFTFDFIGTMFELYILDTGTPGTLKFEAISSTNPVWLDLNGTNFSGFNSPAGQINTTTGIYPMGATDNLIRVVGYSMPSDRYTVRVTLPLQTVTNAQLSVLAFGENAPTYQIQKYNEQTLDPSALYMSAEQDVRNFLTLLPDQGGAVGVEGGTGTGVTVVSAPEEVADLTPAGGYQAMMSNGFFSSPTDPNGQVDLSRTNATWNPAKYLFNIHAQQSVSVTVTGENPDHPVTSFVIGTTITGFTVKVGDIIFNYAQNVFRTITAVTGAIGTLDAAFPSNFTNGSCMVSQAVWTRDLVTLGDPASGNQPVQMFPSTSIPVINTSYQDSVGSGNDIPDMTALPVVAMSASNAGLSASPTVPLSSTFTTLYKRPVAPAMIPDYILAPNANNQLLMVVYFVVPVMGGNTNVNLIRYDVSFYQENTLANGGVLSSAYAYNSGIANGYVPIHSFNPTNVLGLTQWQMTVPYIMNVNAGTADGDLSVQFNGQTVPRFVGSGAMPATELYYTEINNNTIGFSQDIITGQPTMALQGVRRQGVNDGSVANSNRINALANIMVGTTADVANGTAQYSSLQSAVTAAGTGAVIVVLTGVSITENVTISKRVNISGVGGYDSFINGTVTCAVGCSFTQISGIRVTQFILNSGANGNIIGPAFWSTDYLDLGTGNSISGVNIT